MKMPRQIYYTSEWENKNKYLEISLWISGKAGGKHFFAEYAIQSHYISGIWALKH